jgi:hypothetical protein
MSGFDYAQVLAGIEEAQRQLDRLVAEGDMTGARAFIKAYPYNPDELNLKLAIERAEASRRPPEPETTTKAATPPPPPPAEPDMDEWRQAHEERLERIHSMIERGELDEAVKVLTGDELGDKLFKWHRAEAKRLFARHDALSIALSAAVAIRVFQDEYTLVLHLNAVRRCKQNERIDTIDARLAALEARPEVVYHGVHEQQRQYSAGSLVTRKGALWLAKAENRSTPGASGDWQLIVKQGTPAPSALEERLAQLERELAVMQARRA